VAIETKASPAIEARNFLEQRQRAYKLCFGSPAGKEVLADLMKFCRANESTFDDDPRRSDILIGRREVWLRITEHFGIELDDLLGRYKAVLVVKPSEEDND